MDLSVISLQPLSLSVSFAPDDACFNNHFPGNPVVPGSLVMGLSLQAIREHLGRSGPLRVQRFSFSRFARPGSYTLDIKEEGETCLCTLHSEGTLFAQGRITT